MKKPVLFLLILAACAPGGEPLGPYTYSAVKTDDGWRMVIRGYSDVSEKELRKYLKTHGRKLCGEQTYLLRGLKDSYLKSEKRHILAADIDCVESDYFE